MRVRQIRMNISQLTPPPASAGNSRVDTNPGRPVVRVRAENHALPLERVRAGYETRPGWCGLRCTPGAAGWLDVAEIARVPLDVLETLAGEETHRQKRRGEAETRRRGCAELPGSGPPDLETSRHPIGAGAHNRQASGLGPYQPPWASHPPSTAMLDPVMNDASSLARNATAVATSRGSAYRPIGVRRTMSSAE
jgi:hypothetical protein